MNDKVYSIGIDCGSTFCKGALYSKGEVRALAVKPTGWNIAVTGSQIMNELLECRGLSPDVPVVATGYGRDKIPAARTITEITCHARGAE